MNDLIERLEKARDFPHNTCGASRHVQMLGEILSKGRTPPAFAEEPQHIGESMLATVAALYEARTEIRSAAGTIERLEAERDEWKRLCDDGGKVEVHFQQLAERLEAENARLRTENANLRVHSARDNEIAEAENARLRAALAEAKEAVQSWGAYAGEVAPSPNVADLHGAFRCP